MGPTPNRTLSLSVLYNAGPTGTRIVQHDTCREKDGPFMKVSEDSTLPVVGVTTLITITEMNDDSSLQCRRILQLEHRH